MEPEVLLGWLAELRMIAHEDGTLDLLVAGAGPAQRGDAHAHWRVFAALAAVPLQRPARRLAGAPLSRPS